MRRNEYEHFAKLVCQELGRQVGDDEELFWSCNNDSMPSGYVWIKKFQSNYHPLYTPGSSPGNYTSGHTYNIGIKNSVSGTYLTENLALLLAAYLEDLWLGRYRTVDLHSVCAAKMVSRVLFRQFIEQFTNITGVDLWILDDLSLRNYESEKCQGTLLFLEKDSCVVEVEVSTTEPICFFPDQLRRIRKLMAGGKDYALVFSREDSSDPFPERFILKGYTRQVQVDGWVVNISHPGVFNISLGNQPLFRMNHLRPQLIQAQLPQQLKKVYQVFDIKDPTKHKKLDTLLEQIDKQKHGAAVLFLNLKDNSGAEERVRNLFCQERGYAVRGSPTAAQAAMDGAVIVDVSTCEIVYIGVIVDGIVREKGDMSRGARHNSIDTFVRDFHTQHREEPVAAIVFSEDGGSTLYCP